MSVRDFSKEKFKSLYSELGTTRVDVANTTTTYHGFAKHGALPSEAKWFIAREYISGTETITEYADEDEDIQNDQGDQIWDDRVSIFGSIPFANNFSVLFDGVNDYADLGNPVLLQRERTDPWSWSFWIKMRSTTAAQMIYSKKVAANSAGITIEMGSAGRIAVNVYSTGVLRAQVLTNTGSILAGTWYHVVVTYAGTSLASGIKIYLNGQLPAQTVANDTLGANSIANSASAYLGQIASTSFFDGYMDEVSFWSNYVLSAAEVTAMWNSGDPTDLSTMATYSSCTSWWRMGDIDTQPILADVKGAISGTLTNMTSTPFVLVTP